MDVYRGDIFFVHKYGQVIGSEQEAGRPAVIVSNNQGNKTSNNVTIVYLTSQVKKPMTTHCDIVAQVKSTALCETITSVSKDRLGNYLRTCTEKEMEKIDECLKVALGMDYFEAKPKGNLDGAVKALNESIDDLKMKLEGAERDLEVQGKNADFYKEECKKANNLNDAVISENAKLLDENNRLKAELKAPKHFDDDSIRLETERDLYKNLYEQLLEKMVG